MLPKECLNQAKFSEFLGLQALKGNIYENNATKITTIYIAVMFSGR